MSMSEVNEVDLKPGDCRVVREITYKVVQGLPDGGVRVLGDVTGPAANRSSQIHPYDKKDAVSIAIYDAVIPLMKRIERLEEYVEASTCGKTDEILRDWRKFKAEHERDDNG